MPEPHPAFRSDTTYDDLAGRPQVDLEMELYSSLLRRLPDQPDILRAMSSNLTQKGLLRDGLKIDQRLVTLRPNDPTAHYNLACRYAVLSQPDMALHTLRNAIELGYRDFRYMIQDRDLMSLRRDPRFHALLVEYGM